MIMSPLNFLSNFLDKRLSQQGAEWLDDRIAGLGSPVDRQTLYVTIGLIPRRLGKDELAADARELANAAAVRPGWDLRGWTISDAARVLVLGTGFERDKDFAAVFVELCRTADVAELVAFYRGLPLYSNPEQLDPQVGEGLRSNVQNVFEAIAHRNPYPGETFGSNRWNQMVLKALFIGCRLHPIQGLDERGNHLLAQTLCETAHERWAAGRPISPEIWRCVGPFANDAMMDDLEKVLATGDELERQAAALALQSNDSERARSILSSHPALVASVANEGLSWDVLSERL